MSFDTFESSSRPICLDQFLKLVGVADTGGMAKVLIQDGQILVNGEIETRRRKQLAPDDRVQFQDDSFVVGDYLRD